MSARAVMARKIDFPQQVTRFRSAWNTITREMFAPRRQEPEQRQVLIIEEAAGHPWRAIHVDLSGPRVRVLAAWEQYETALEAASMPLVLVPDTKKTVCRLLQLTETTPENLERIVAMRLEMELPFAPGECIWSSAPHLNEAGTASQVLLIAIASSEVAQAEKLLRPQAPREVLLEFGPAGLTELIAPGERQEASQAVARAANGEVLLAISCGGCLCYARTLRVDCDAAAPEQATVLAGELRQTFLDYKLRTKNPQPERLYVTGGALSSDAFQRALEAQLAASVMPVPAPPVDVEIDAPPLEALVQAWPIGLGAALALHRRMHGQKSMSPAFRGIRNEGAGWKQILALKRPLALNALLLALLLASSSFAYSWKMSGLNALVEESGPALEELELVEEEVSILRQESRKSRASVDLLRDLAQLLPAQLKLETVSVDSSGKVTLAGRTPDVDAASEAAINALEKSASFVKPTFNGATRGNDDYTFQITCEFRGGRGAGR